MPIDLSDHENAGLIPPGTDPVVQFKVRRDEATGNALTLTKNRDAETLKLEATIVEGPFARGKVWADFLVTGTTEGQKMMCDKNKAMLKLIIDSARDIDPSDKSPEARQKRTLVRDWDDFDGMRAQVVIGIEPERINKQTGQVYQARNVIEKVVTRNMPNWRGPIQQFSDPPFGHGAAAPQAHSQAQPNGPAAAQAQPQAPQAAPMAKPSWAR
jgi:hypothetical protein